jgi:crossover junction endodeoxyribonuclease RuvC
MIEKYKILGLDPGTNLFGYAIIEIEGNKTKLLTMGALRLKSHGDHQTKLKEIFLQIQEMIETYLPKELAIEAPFFGKNVQSMLKLGRAQGVAIAAGITMGLNISEYAPKKIKQSITGNGNASKEQVSAMLENIFKIKITSGELDASDALAAAYTHFNQSGNPFTKNKKYTGWAAYLKDNPQKSR